MSNMVFYCTDHDGLWPVGVASIVVAPSESIARLILWERLKERGLEKGEFTLQKLDTSTSQAIILNDGNY